MGSAIAALTFTRTEEEFERDMKPEVLHRRLYEKAVPWRDRINRLIMTGSMWDHDEWLEGTKWFTCGELTFLEAYKKTGRTLCISLSTTHSASPPILLNHITAPSILVYSAITASVSVPSFLPPAHLLTKNPDGTVEVLKEEYYDGSMEQVSSTLLSCYLHLILCLTFTLVLTLVHYVFLLNALGYSQGKSPRAAELSVLCGCSSESPACSISVLRQWNSWKPTTLEQLTAWRILSIRAGALSQNGHEKPLQVPQHSWCS